MIRAAAGLAAGLLLAGAAAAACGGESPSPPVATTQVDLPKSYEFRPAAITVRADTTVTWTNHDNFTHTVRLIDQGDRVIGTMAPGQRVTYTFTSPGTYRYDCSLHPQDMRGQVVVT